MSNSNDSGKAGQEKQQETGSSGNAGLYDLPASSLWRLPWLADLLFGMTLAIPATLLGIANQWWTITQGWRVFVPVVVVALVVLPAYRHAIRTRTMQSLRNDQP